MAAVEYTVADGVAHIELNRPESANALDLALGVGLREAAERAAEDEGVRAVVLSGAGKRFCGGGDIASFADSQDTAGDLYELAVAGDAAESGLEVGEAVDERAAAGTQRLDLGAG